MVSLGACWLAGTGSGLFWSLDGEAWERVGAYPFRVTSIGRSNGRTVVSVGSGLWEVGETPEARWTQLHDETLTEVLGFAWMDGDPGIAAASAYGVAIGSRDENGAARWRFLSDTLSPNARFTNTLISGSHPGLISGTEAGVLRSPGPNGPWSESSLMGTAVRALVQSEGKFHAGCDDRGVWKSADGDAWERAGSGLDSETVYSLAVTADGLMAGTEHGIYTGDGTGPWREVGPCQRVTAVAATDELWMAGCVPGGLWTSTSRGENWLQINSVPEHVEALLAPEGS